MKSETAEIMSQINEKLKALYPVGAIYITTADKCPLATMFPETEWVPVAKGKCLWGYTGSGPGLGETIPAGLPGLPPHSHTFSFPFS